jgi:hypothetical protein
VLLLKDEELNRLLRSAAVIRPVYEALAVAAGLFVGFMAVEDWPAGGGPGSWIDRVSQVSLPLMYGLLAWVIYGSFAETRFMGVLLHQPLRADPLNTTPLSRSAGSASCSPWRSSAAAR